MAQMTKAQRKKAEQLVYDTMDKLDKTGSNTKYYKELFEGMSDAQFLKLMQRELPLRFHYNPSVTEPTMSDMQDALKLLNVPMLEKVSEPFLYVNEKGESVNTKECLVGYCPIKKMQQFVTKKNKISTEISNRDMKTGRLNSTDKGATMSDREFESLATTGLDYTMREFAAPRADAMESKNAMYNIISTTGMIRQTDIPFASEDSLSRNMLNAYMMGAHLGTNLVNKGNYTMRTIQQKRGKQVERN